MRPENQVRNTTNNKKAPDGHDRRGCSALKGGFGITATLFISLAAFTAFALIVVWIFQVLLLPRFYERSKMSEMYKLANVIERHIESNSPADGTENTVFRMANENSICVLTYAIKGTRGQQILSCDVSKRCLIHHIPSRNIDDLYREAQDNGGTLTKKVDFAGNTDDENGEFEGDTVYVRIFEADGNEYMVEDYVVEGFDSHKPGEQNVRVRYGDYFEIFTVWVNYPTVSPEDAPVVKVSTEKCLVGNTVDVVVSLSNNKGFANLGLEIEYDRALTLVSVTPNSTVGATFTMAQTLDVYPYNIGWNSILDTEYNGDLVTLTFEVPEDTQPGEYFVDVNFYRGRDGNYIDGISVNYDEDEMPLGLRYENGSVNVYDYIPGDINGDEVVDNKDGTAMLRYLAGWDLDEIVVDALDTDGDGTVTNKDGTRLLRYLAGWEVEIF